MLNDIHMLLRLDLDDVANMQSIERKILHSLEATTWLANEESDCTVQQTS